MLKKLVKTDKFIFKPLASQWEMWYNKIYR